MEAEEMVTLHLDTWQEAHRLPAWSWGHAENVKQALEHLKRDMQLQVVDLLTCEQMTRVKHAFETFEHGSG